MTSSTQIKGLLAGLAAVAITGAAFAQGNPPTTAIKNAPIAAGQQSSQKTPMGETGVQAQPAGTTAATTTGSSTSSGTSMGASGSTTATDTSVAANSTPRRVRADRN
ncbi:MAG: proteophosphoglycan ppg4 [Burkholderiales bacterium]|nr:proteophosphoglycan ppg4 [Burkholderiales bacterium]